MNEKTVNLAALFYERRAQLRALLGDKFDGRVAEMRPYIEACMKEWNLDVLPTAIRMMKEAEKEMMDNPTFVPLIVSAALDIIERPKEVVKS